MFFNEHRPFSIAHGKLQLPLVSAASYPHLSASWVWGFPAFQHKAMKL
jgi:hypothetical protein